MGKRRPDTRVVIESPPDANAAGTGGVIGTEWATAATAMATIDAASGGESELGAALVGVQRYVVEFRWPGFRVPTTYRVRPTHGPYSGAELCVEASAATGTRRERMARLICKEGRAG